MTYCRGLLVCVMLALTVLLCNPLYAQVAGATLGGTVTDASGAAVPNANVSIKNTATGVAREISASRIETVKTEFGAKTMGFDPKTHNLFLTTADFGPAPPVPTKENPEAERKPIPGTFCVLIYGR